MKKKNKFLHLLKSQIKSHHTSVLIHYNTEKNPNNKNKKICSSIDAETFAFHARNADLYVLTSEATEEFFCFFIILCISLLSVSLLESAYKLYMHRLKCIDC